MSIITTGTKAPGLEKGYPKVSRRLEGSRIVRATDLRVVFHTDDPQETGIALEMAIYAQYPEFSVGVDLGGGFTIRQTSLSRDTSHRLKHYLDVHADDQVTDQEKEDQNKPPDQRRPDWSWDFETQEIVMTHDIDGEPVMTSADDPIEVTTPVAVAILTITVQRPGFSPDQILDYVNHVNSASFWGAPPGTALMAGIREQKGETYNGVEYRAISYTIKFHIPDIPDVIEGWKLILVDHGPNYLDKTDDIIGVKKAIKDESGSKITGNMDGAGNLLEPGDPPHILRFKQFKEADFGLLNINWPL